MSKLFWVMLSFISRSPVPAHRSQGLDFEHHSRGIVIFPPINVVLGGLTGLVLMALQPWCGIPLAALFAVLTLASLIGGFHLGGPADACNDVFSTRRRGRMLGVIRGGRLGTHGGLALIFVLLAGVLVVSELALRGAPMLAVLAAACVAGRGMAVLLMYRHRYARERGLDSVFTGKVTGCQTCATLELAAILAAVLLPGMRGVAALIVTIMTIFILGRLLKCMLGRQTGDTPDAATKLGELIFLLALF